MHTPARYRLLTAAALLGLLASLPGPRLCADFTWNGDGDGDLWTTGDNWVGSAAPDFDLAGQALIFGETNAEEQSPDAGNGDYFNIAGLSFTGADASLTLIGSGSLSFEDGAAITNDSNFLQTINIDIVGNGDSLVIDALTADLTIGGGIDLRDSGGVELTVQGNSDTTIEGIIRGDNGSLVKTGDGSLTLSGANTYGGGTTLEAGTIVLGNDSALGDGDLAVTGDGDLQSDDDDRNVGNDISIDDTITLTLSGENNFTLSGVISGDGALDIDFDDDDDEILLTGENTYTGGTTLTLGTLVLGNDDALGEGDLTLAGDGSIASNNNNRTIENNIDNGGNLLTFSGDFDLKIKGIISGVGGLTVDAEDARLVLTEDNTYTGDTNIDGGELMIKGSVDSDIFVNEDGALSGSGSTAGSVTVADGGTFSPGNSVGTFTIEGDYDQEEGGIFRVDIDAEDGEADLLRVTGAATLADGAKIRAAFASTGYIVSGETFTIIEADGGITDDGADIINDSATLTFELIREEDFENGDTTYALEVFRAADAFEAAADRGNNRAIGTALDSLVSIANDDPDGDVGDLLGELDVLNRSGYNDVVSQLSPEPHNTATMLGVDAVRSFAVNQSAYLAAKRSGIDAWSVRMRTPRPGSVAFADHNPSLLAAAMAQMEEAQTPPSAVAPSERRWGTYARFHGVRSTQDTTTNRTGYEADSIGGQVGVDYRFTRDFTAGIAAAYINTDADWKLGLGELQIDSVRVGPYMGIANDNWYIDGSFTFGYHFYDSTRNIPSLSRTATAEYDGYDLTAFLTGGYHIKLREHLHLTPNASFQYTYFDFDSFTESGAQGANLTVANRDADSLRSRLGVDLSYYGDWGVKVLPHAFVGWEHDYSDDDDVEARFAAGGSPFFVDAGERDSDALYYGAGVDLLLESNLSAFVHYERVTGENNETYGIVAGLGVSF